MLGRLRNSFAEVDLTLLEQNYLSLKSALAPQCFLAPMVKADAYGHGDVQVSRVCERLGARYLGVSLIEEGIKLRLEGIQTPILVFSSFDTMGADALVKYRLTPVINSFSQIQKIRSAVSETASFAVHAEFNTGMQRLGFEPSEATSFAQEIRKDNALALTGVCTHFSSSEDYLNKESATVEQVGLFKKIAQDVKAETQHPLLFHYLNSGAILMNVQPQFDLARPGIALYGAQNIKHAEKKLKLSPVLNLKSFVASVRSVKKGTKVSYGGTWSAQKESQIAVVPLGYADGVPRSLSNKGSVLIHGERVPIVGIVCMDYFMIDVTKLGEKNLSALEGDEIVLLGQQKEETIFAQEWADLTHTISYEILTGIQARVPRIYIH